MLHVYLGFLIPVMYSFGTPTFLKVMDLQTNQNIKQNKTKKQQNPPKQQKQQAPNNSWLRFVFTGLHSKSCVGFICFKFRA